MADFHDAVEELRAAEAAYARLDYAGHMITASAMNPDVFAALFGNDNVMSRAGLESLVDTDISAFCIEHDRIAEEALGKIAAATVAVAAGLKIVAMLTSRHAKITRRLTSTTALPDDAVIKSFVPRASFGELTKLLSGIRQIAGSAFTGAAAKTPDVATSELNKLSNSVFRLNIATVLDKVAAGKVEVTLSKRDALKALQELEAFFDPKGPMKNIETALSIRYAKLLDEIAAVSGRSERRLIIDAYTQQLIVLVGLVVWLPKQLCDIVLKGLSGSPSATKTAETTKSALVKKYLAKK
jgi:hypothetical protein